MESFFFTQCAAVLFADPPPLEDVERALEGWHVSGSPNVGEGEHGWALSGPGFVVALRAGAAFAAVDVVEHPWPDDPAVAATNPAMGGAWRAGAFGPFSLPGALARAADQSGRWQKGAEAAAEHRAFVRLRTGYGVPDGLEREVPKDYDPSYELTTVTELAQALLRLPGALALFVPAGEALRSREQVEAALSRKVGSGPPPFDLWSNVRAISLVQEGDVRWLALDVVGLAQLRLPDHEAIFAEGQERPEAVEAMLLNLCRHLLSGKGIAPGSTCDDGRGRKWRSSAVAGILAPQRPVLRWLPEESARPSEATLAKLFGAPPGQGTP